MLLKLTKWRQSDVKPGIFVYENLFTDSWVDVISANFNSKKVYEDEIFGRQDTLQFFSRESKDYKCLRKIFGVSGTLSDVSKHSYVYPGLKRWTVFPLPLKAKKYHNLFSFSHRSRFFVARSVYENLRQIYILMYK